ncbi:ABC transporter substrate-binding protein [Streptomyces sp. NPDC000594]|uniref:ABC transporter substrate-binding protein n=1 Tax=Streptomyces sp. NPDC000594 TaxID=3154261 RepID=UPI003329B7A4
MFHRICLRTLATLASLSVLAGCGLLDDDASDDKEPIVVGTTSEPTTLDPAGAWDGSWELYRNVFQTLLSFPTGSTTPQPDAARLCRFRDSGNRVYVCELKEGLTFSDGSPLDAAAVKHSLDRIVTIDEPGGPRGLLHSLDRIEVTGELTVRFRLKAPDATFPLILATPAMALVPPGKYPADRLRGDGRLTGSGPYTLKTYVRRDRAELVRNDSYQGFAERRNQAVTIRYFRDSEDMMKALRGKRLDATFRGMVSRDVVEMQAQGARGDRPRLVESVGVDIRYLVFNAKDATAGRPAVRRAVAQLVDRGALVSRVYQGTAEPLYSMIPKGITGHTTEFFDRYGEPSAAKARRILRDAGIDTPVKLAFWYSTDRYGSGTRAEFAELKRQLEADGLFRIEIRGLPETRLQRGYKAGEYPVFGRGWFPDFPDPDNFVSPFVGRKNVLATPYESREITERLLPASRREGDRSAVVRDFERAQQIIAKDVRLLPLWQSKLYVAVSERTGGGERAIDPQTIMQMWELYRRASW